MPDICILTPDPADRDFHTRWREILARLDGFLAAGGMTTEARSWVDAGDLAAFDLVLPLLVWGYHRAGSRWTDQVTTWEQTGIRLQNPPETLRWNADKSYLGRLAERGAPVAPALFSDRLTLSFMQEAAAQFGTDQLVAKPRVSATAWQTIRWSPGQPLDGGPEGPAIVQPYLPDIETSGETSLIWLGGRFSHAISKRPRAGDFRVQPEYDGIIAACEPDADELDAAGKILACLDEPPLYARIDLVRGLEGAPVLMELELVEPDLYLEYDPSAGPAFAKAVAAAAVQSSSSCRP